jgi:hypothetical protein
MLYAPGAKSVAMSRTSRGVSWRRPRSAAGAATLFPSDSALRIIGMVSISLPKDTKNITLLADWNSGSPKRWELAAALRRLIV